MNQLDLARRRLMSGPHLAVERREEAQVVLLVALDHDGDQLAALAAAIVDQQRRSPTFKPVFLVSTSATRCLSDAGFAFESILPQPDWERLSLPGSYDGYREGRVRASRLLYAPDRFIELAPDSAVELTQPFGDDI